jgi:hypothetical protein
MTDASALETLARLADESEAAEIAAEARALAGRAAEGRFYVACVGQFKRGKSTLINALVGTSVLPTGVVPVTALPTVVRHGEPAVRVKRQDGAWIAVDPGTLAAWVTEQGNPGNRKRVAGVEVFVPSPLLAAGMCLVDTPGLGSVFEANAGATRAFVPHIDAAVVVLGADPPISADELALVGEVAGAVDHLVFVLNKADRLSPGESREAAVFAEQVLSRRLGYPVGRLLEVSALAATQDPPEAGEWNSLVGALERLALSSRQALVAAAVSRGLDRLGRRLRRVLLEQQAALVRPIEESERRVRGLTAVAADTDRALVELGPLLGVDQQRVSLGFGYREAEFLAQAGPAGVAALRERLAAAAPTGPGLGRRKALELANGVAREVLRPWLEDSERAADHAYRETVGRFVELANGILRRVGSATEREVAEPGIEVGDADSLARKRGFYFTDLLSRHLPATPWVWIVDACVPRTLRRRRAATAAERYVGDLLRVNAARVRADLDERLRNSRHRLEVLLRTVLHAGRQAAARALDRARAARAAGRTAVEREVAEIDHRLARLDGIHETHRAELVSRA